MKAFPDWKTAHVAAVQLANMCERETGIRKAREFGRTVYTVRILPDQRNRCGEELTCEVVRPGDPE